MTAPTHHRHSDGTMANHTEETDRMEEQVAGTLERCWKCTIKKFPAMHPIDFYAERHGRIVSFVEFRSREIPSTKYDTIFLDFFKHYHLCNSALLYNVPAYFVVRFTDQIRYIDALKIDAKNHGTLHRDDGKGPANEPIVRISVADMSVLNDKGKP